VIASGGMGSIEHFIEAATTGGADAVSMADVLHYNRIPLAAIRDAGRAAGLAVRSL
jgi:cyclase